MKRFVAMLLILALAGCMALGQETVEEPISYDDVVAAIGTMNELLEQAIFLATAGMASSLISDQLAYAQGAIDLLSGSGDSRGILDVWAIVDAAMDSENDHPARETVLNLVDRKDRSALYSAVYSTTGDFLRLAADAALLAHAEASRGRDGREAAQDGMRSVYAYLISARGVSGDIRVFPGSLFLAELLPPMEVWARPGESIQAAIDRVPDGGTIRLEPGVYREGLVINRSLTLSGSVGSVIDSARGIVVESDFPIDVVIRDLRFEGGQGLTVYSQGRVIVENVSFVGVGNAAQIKDGGHADFVSCHLSENFGGVWFSWSASGSLWDCTIEGCTSDSGAVSLYCSEVSVTDCVIRDNVGPGIRVGGGEASKLHMTGCQLLRNAYGLAAIYGSCNPSMNGTPEDTPRYAKSHGTISGWENVIPEPWEDDGNLEGAFEVYFTSFIDLRTLLEPKPEEEGS